MGFPLSSCNLEMALNCTHNEPLDATGFMLSLGDVKQSSWQPRETRIPCDSDPEVEVQRSEVTHLKSHSWGEMKMCSLVG